MKLVVMKMPGHIPHGGFHYCVVPKRMEDANEHLLWELQGHVVVEVSEEHGERLLKEAGAALCHQIEVATLTEKKLAAQ